MSASFFSTITRKSDPAEAFEAAVAEAFWAQPPGGYTGTVADKESYVIMQTAPLRATDAQVRARELDEDPRIEDKWGPAGAIAVVHHTRVVKVEASLPSRRFIGPAGDQQIVTAATDALRATEVLRPGEEVIGAYRMPLPDRYLIATIGRADADLTPQALASADPDGWLFFGWSPI